LDGGQAAGKMRAGSLARPRSPEQLGRRLEPPSPDTHLPAKKGSTMIVTNAQTAQDLGRRRIRVLDSVRCRRGFTMVELMVTVVVIAILASATGYVATRVIGQSVESTMKGDAHTIKNPLVEHYVNFNQFPSAIAPSTGTASATTMLFDATDGNAVAIAAGSTTTEVTVNITNPKRPGYTCSITVRSQGSAKPNCA
jgi:prepilin-type N-terminal cleavage/methylation domain-containing protein